MKLQHLNFPALMGMLAGIMMIPAAHADPVLKRTEVTFPDPIEIPGMVLMPGTYVMKLLDPTAGESSNKDIVRFYDKNEKHMYAMVFAVPDYRPNTVDHTVITFEERAGDSPRAIKEWFYPGDHWGEQFVYSKVKAAHPTEAALAPATPAPTVAAAPGPQAQPQPAVQGQPKQEPVQVAQAQPAPARNQPAVQTPAVAPAPNPAPPKELPKTASDLPLAALGGGVLLLAGACLRRKSA